MRPLRLTLQAIGPFGGTELIDFQELGNRHLFLLHGPTGAGKSTILDAMCYALYGETSGSERTAEQMCSHWRESGVQTQVTFDFALGKECYRVERVPAQEVPKKRGTGMRSINGSARLWKRTGVVGDDDEGQVLATKAREVTSWIEELLGFKSEQFRQVIMLPQGRFRDVLQAQSREREEILETLFGTHLFSRIEEQLKENARHVTGKLEQLQQERMVLLQSAGVETREDLSVKTGEVERLIELENQRVIDLKKETERHNAAYASGQAAEERFQELESAGKALEELKRRTEEMELRRNTLRNADLAERLRESFAELRVREKEESKLRADREAALRQAESLNRRHSEAQTLLVALEQDDPGLRGLQRRIDQMESYLPRAKRLMEATKEDAEAKRSLQDLRATEETLQSGVDRIGRECEQVGRELEQARLAEARLGGLRETAARLERLEEQKRALVKARERVAERGKSCDAAMAEQRRVVEKLDQLTGELDSAEGSWRRAQAAMLAAELHEGDPCPVCGSREHPKPVGKPSEAVGEDGLERMRASVREMEHGRAELGRQVASIEAELDLGRQRVGELEEELGRLLGDDSDRLDELLAEARDTLSASERHAGELNELSERHEKLVGEQARLGQHLESTRRQAQEERAREAAAGRVVEEVRRDIPVQYRDAIIVEREREKLQKEWNRKKELLDKARSEEREMGLALAATKNQCETLQRQSETARKNVEERRKRFVEKRMVAGFESDEAFSGALLAPERFAELQGEVSRWEKALAMAADRHARAAKAVEDIERPDIPALRQACERSSQALDECARKHQALLGRLEQFARVEKDLARNERRYREAEKQFGTVQHVANMASGKNAHRLSFHRYVLGVFLEDVLAAATYRLLVMSRNRYRLSRVQAVTDARRTGGLDLEVFDEYTGEARPVSTLSGGEGFLASLALALGMAEVVQQYAGGVRLETIFIDEGFGSLDSESLDQAMNALIDLQKGRRLVGLISHVPELRERIDTRLEVQAGPRGSTTRWRQ